MFVNELTNRFMAQGCSAIYNLCHNSAENQTKLEAVEGLETLVQVLIAFGRSNEDIAHQVSISFSDRPLILEIVRN